MVDHGDEVPRRLENLEGLVSDVLAEVKKTNGRVTDVERQIIELDTATGKLTGDMVNVRRTIFGNEKHGLQSDGGLVGWVRQTRREIRLAGAAIVFIAPGVWIALDRLVKAWFG